MSIEPHSPFGPTPLHPAREGKQPPPFPSTTAPVDKGLEPWLRMLPPGATPEDAKQFRSQTLRISNDFIKNRLAKIKENAKKNQRFGLYGEY